MERFTEQYIADNKTYKDLETLEREWKDTAKQCTGTGCLYHAKLAYESSVKDTCGQYWTEYLKLLELKKISPTVPKSLEKRIEVVNKEVRKCPGLKPDEIHYG